VADTLPIQASPRPGELTAREDALREAFLAEVDRIPGGDKLQRCIQCGTCSGTCPVSHAMDVQPRQLVAYFRAGDIESILRSRTIWICASCYACTVRCPAGIKVTDLIYALKRMAMERKTRAGGQPVLVLSEQFVRLVNRYGRNHELKLLLRYYLRTAPFQLFKMLPLGWRLLRTGRLQWRADRVKAIADLRRIIAKAEEMEQAYPKETLKPMGRVGYGLVAEHPGGKSARGAA